jgi:hypothetical protein
MTGRPVPRAQLPADIDRLIALWDSPDYDTGGPLPAEQQADDDSATWCVWEGGPFVHHAQSSARRFDRRRQQAADPPHRLTAHHTTTTGA